MYAVRDVPGKGKGLVATRNITKGTRILCERPLISIPNGISNEDRQCIIYDKVEVMNKKERDIFLSFPNRYEFSDPATQYNGIFITSSILAASEPHQIFAIFPNASRINHDCNNNSLKDWNHDTHRYTVHAMRDIHAGEEITVSYETFLTNHETRQQRFKDFLHFTCICRTCHLPYEQREERDHKIDQIVCLIKRADEVPLEGTTNPWLTMLRYIDARVSVFQQLDREDRNYGLALADAARLAIMMGDSARGRVFALKTAAIWQRLLGSDNPLTKKYTKMARSPKRDDNDALDLWKTAITDIPRGLGPDEFEDWLWKREKPRLVMTGEIVLKRRNFFFPFSELPHKSDVCTDGSFKNRRHWCFLGEMLEDPLSIVPLSVEVMDMDNKKTKVHFYTKTRGSEFKTYRPRPEATIAILDATQHDFHWGPPGIRHKDPRMIKVFHHPVPVILALEHEVRSYSTTRNDLRHCHGCDTIGASSSMKRCAKCLSFWYCSKNCQIVSWVTKGHKAFCKLLQDPDLRGLFLTKWDEVQKCDGFPLKTYDGYC
ncbi:hypothetical protein E4U30_006366 [Claviceps sp. LM220 group G6]|nr:hypothetical protein E4U30_006366 [Claviceps sp. LM220 group G6]